MSYISVPKGLKATPAQTYTPVPISPQVSCMEPMVPRDPILRRESRNYRPGVFLYFLQGRLITEEERDSLPVATLTRLHLKVRRRPESWKKTRKTQWRSE